MEIPMIGAAGLYTSARDLAKFVQFYLNWEEVRGHSVLNKWFAQSTEPPKGFLHTAYPNPYSDDLNTTIRDYPELAEYVSREVV